MVPEASARALALRYLWLARTLLFPAVLAALVVFALREPLSWWLHGEEIYDQEAIKEWVREARVGFRTLPELVKDFAQLSARCTEARS